MIRGLHGLFYSSQAEATRAFLRDKLKLPFCDVGGGWLIFDFPEGDLGVHPTGEGESEEGTHNLSFYCDDIEGTMAELQARGVKFDMEAADHGYGYVTYFTMPGGVKVQLYEPKYRKAGASKPKVKPKSKSKARPKPKARPRKRR
jgi:predicted enzyme related to lactoylglutathione lyase